MQRGLSETATPASGMKLLIDHERLGLPMLHRTRADGFVEVFVLEPGDDYLTVGRADHNAVTVDDDPSVSRTHLELSRLGDGWMAQDAGLSRNGTLIDGALLQGRQRLRDGCRLTVGQTVIEYRAPIARTGAAPTVTAIGRAAPPAITAAQRAVLIEFTRPMLEGAAAPASNAQVAAALVVSPETVKTHLSDLYVRFGLEDVPPAVKRAELAQRAIRLGVVGRGDL
jgi:pSer/pThr/pTyr-binding forkhead associated (FHA) protein/DNA-binding CsgD family transcriptional regulator